MVLFSRLNATFSPYHISTNDSVTTAGAADGPTTLPIALRAAHRARHHPRLTAWGYAGKPGRLAEFRQWFEPHIDSRPAGAVLGRIQCGA